MKIPFVSWFDKVAEEAIYNVYSDVNKGAEKYKDSLDLLRKFRDRHVDSLVTEISNIQILSMQGPVNLTDIYVQTKLTQKISKNFFYQVHSKPMNQLIEEMLKRQQEDIYKILDSHDSLLVMGAPGSGKTTFVSALALGHIGKCDSVSKKIKNKKLPIYVSLRDVESLEGESLSEPDSFVKKVLERRSNKKCEPFIQRLIQKGEVLLILDGLDEVPQKNLNTWLGLIKRIRAEYDQIQIIVTTRSNSVNVDINGFYHFEVMPFSERDAENFIKSWFGEGEKKKSKRLIKALSKHPAIQELALRPLLLALICILYESDLELPTQKTEVFNRAVDAMLLRWDTTRGFRRKTVMPQITLSKRRHLFQYVAAQLTNGETYHMEERILSVYIERFLERQSNADRLTSQEVLAELESHYGLIYSPAANLRSFSHNSIQDYFTAEYLKETNQGISFIKKNFGNKKHREIIVFLNSILEDSGNHLEILRERSNVAGKVNYPALAKRLNANLLIIKSLAEGAALNPQKREQLEKRVFGSLTYVTKHLQDTGLNLYFKVIGEEVKVMCTHFKYRQSTLDVLISIEELVNSIAYSNYKPILDLIVDHLSNESMCYSTRAIFAACLVDYDVDQCLMNCRSVVGDENLPERFKESMDETVEDLEGRL